MLSVALFHCYSEYSYAECRIAILSIVMVTVIMLSFVMLYVIGVEFCPCRHRCGQIFQVIKCSITSTNLLSD
jgi:hypothetical protein